MSWSRDGSGLLVYRHRGRTVAQRFAPLDAGPFGREHRRSHWSDPTVFARGSSGPKRFREMVKQVKRNKWARQNKQPAEVRWERN
jgi:hypothetical protein